MDYFFELPNNKINLQFLKMSHEFKFVTRNKRIGNSGCSYSGNSCSSKVVSTNNSYSNNKNGSNGKNYNDENQNDTIITKDLIYKRNGCDSDNNDIDDNNDDDEKMYQNCNVKRKRKNDDPSDCIYGKRAKVECKIYKMKQRNVVKNNNITTNSNVKKNIFNFVENKLKCFNIKEYIEGVKLIPQESSERYLHWIVPITSERTINLDTVSNIEIILETIYKYKIVYFEYSSFSEALRILKHVDDEFDGWLIRRVKEESSKMLVTK